MTTPALPPLRFEDPAAFGYVAVLMGGTSSEREVSLDSGRNVLDALRSRGVDANAVDGLPNLVRELQAQKPGKGGFDRVFNILHGGQGENGVLQGMLESLGMPYTGSGVLGSALTMDKVRTKQVWMAAGLPTPRFERLPPGADLAAAAARIGYPAFVKPSCEGSSVGVFRLLTEADLAPALAFASGYDGELLVERMVRGDELTVAVLGDVALPSIRIVPTGEWYDYHAKYVADDNHYLCPGFDGDDEAAIRALSLAAFRAAGCAGWGRVDVMHDRALGLQLIEVNTAPGMTSHSLVPKAAAAVGCDYAELCWRVLEQTL
ncbi:MAG TPA: D-alanine--D-alanine ligase [Luteimonas sp.]|nr:D-alanine--D-alanine ligase [Luteimonas sp.]